MVEEDLTAVMVMAPSTGGGTRRVSSAIHRPTPSSSPSPHMNNCNESICDSNRDCKNDKNKCLRVLSMVHRWPLLLWLCTCALLVAPSSGYANEFDKSEQLLDRLNLEQSIAAVFNKVAYGSTTKRSIPDNAYPVTTLATPLLTTYRYSDGNDEWLRVDVKNSDSSDNNRQSGRSNNNNNHDNPNVDFESEYDSPNNNDDNNNGGRDDSYGADLEKDHVLPTSAPAADILKNNNNKHYNNPNRYNNDRLRPDLTDQQEQQVTENIYKTTTIYNSLRNVRPTKSMYSKDIPSYVPPSRAFFTPPLPPEYQNPFADKPTLRGTNSDGFASRRPLPPPSLMPNKDRIPFRPDLPKVNADKMPERAEPVPKPMAESKLEKKKTLNTPSQQNGRLGEFYGLNRNHNETNFEYEKSYAPEPSITRILSGSNGRHDDIQIPDILYRAVTATPSNSNNNGYQQRSEPKSTKTRAPSAEPSLKLPEPKKVDQEVSIVKIDQVAESVTVKKIESPVAMVPVNNNEAPVQKEEVTVTTQMTDFVNLANTKEKDGNVTTKANSDEIWRICWNVHVYLIVFGFILLAVYSIYQLIRYENDPHMFSKSYFLTIHLMLTVICVLRIFYLIYDPYNFNNSFNVFLYDFLHSFPLSLLATTFAVLILFLLKRTLTHLEVKTRPVFLVVFALCHIVLCFCLSIFESLGHFEKASLIVCRPVFVLLVGALGVSYLYLYRIIKNVLDKKSQHLSEICTQNISYASHITIAVALLFILLGFVQLYALFFIKIDRFNGEIKHHWILWGFELSVRFLEISIMTLLAIVVSLKVSQREKQQTAGGGFPLFPCATSDSSTDNIYPNNCNTNPNALNYSRSEMIMDHLPTETVERPNLLKTAFQNDSFDKKSTLERSYHHGNANNIGEAERTFDRFERPNWSDRSGDSHSNNGGRNSSSSIGPHRKSYDTAKFYNKSKYNDLEDGFVVGQERNIYSEPVDGGVGGAAHQYERTRHEFERSDLDRRSRNSSNTSGRRSNTGRSRKNHPRAHTMGIQTLPNHERHHNQNANDNSMLVDEKGFVRFKYLQDDLLDGNNVVGPATKQKKIKKLSNVDSHYSDA